MLDFKINRNEFKEFLQWKLSNAESQKLALEQEIAEIKEKLANNFSEFDIDTKDSSFQQLDGQKNTRNSVGWKYKAQEVLGEEDGRLTSADIVNKVCAKYPELQQEVAVKSIGSALSTNSKNEDSMFIKETIKGVFYYRNNPAYKK